MKRSILISGIFILILAVGFCLWSYQNNHSIKKDSIVVAYSPFEYMALLWIAEDRGFFSQNGIDLTLHKYRSGINAVDAMLNKEADISMGVTEFPVVEKAFGNEKIHIIGNIAKTDYVYVIGRKDRGIEKGSDLKGKRIGFKSGTILEYYLGRFLNLNGLNMQDITPVDLTDTLFWANAFSLNDIDAVLTVPPYSDSNIGHLGSNAIVWQAQDGQPLYSLIVATDGWIKNHPELAERFLRSLLQAEEYLLSHPAESKAIVQKQMNLNTANIERVWTQSQFSLLLDQTLIVTMEDEARWMIENKLTKTTSVPDFLDFIYFDALVKVKPEAVTIIH
jgi:NitT/TauT family transport system substrate-binding protein